MNPNEVSLISQYFASDWAVWSNLLIITYLGLYTYNAYAKRWSALTGEHHTMGTIIWSELTKDAYGRAHALVGYTYEVNEVPYTGVIAAPKTKLAEFVDAHPMGNAVSIYFSIREPEFSVAEQPPSNIDILYSTLRNEVLFPLLGLHLASVVLFCLISA